MIMPKLLNVLVTSALTLTLSHVAAQAQAEGEALAFIDTIHVTGRDLQQRGLHTLVTAALGVGIGADQIAAVNAYNVEDTVRYAPNLIVRKRYVGDNNALLSFR